MTKLRRKKNYLFYVFLFRKLHRLSLTKYLSLNITDKMGHRKTEDFLWRNFIVFFFVDIFYVVHYYFIKNGGKFLK